MSEMISNQMLTGTTTAKQESWLLPNEKFAIAYGNFADIYNEAKAYSLVRAMIRAKLDFPVPGGPHKSSFAQ